MLFLRKSPIVFAVTLIAAFLAVDVLAAPSTLTGTSSPAQTGALLAAPASPSTVESLRVVLEEFDGAVQLQRKGSADWLDAKKGDVLEEGESIRTYQGSCRLSIDAKASLFVEPNTTLQISKALRHRAEQSEKTQLALMDGKLKVELSKLKKGSSFEVITPTAIAAVRGTIFYLQAGQSNGMPFAQLYVDESSGGVFFKNVISGNSFVVPSFSVSNAFQDGKLEKPLGLSPEQQTEFIKNFNSGSSGPSQQFGVEEVFAGASAAAQANPALDGLTGAINDALAEKIAEQNAIGLNGLNPALATPPGITGLLPDDSNNSGQEPKPDSNSGGTTRPPDNNTGGGTTNPDSTGGGTTTPPDNNTGGGTTTPPDNNTGGGTTNPPDTNTGGGTTTPPDNNTGGGTTPDPVEITPADQAIILSELEAIADDQQFDFTDANFTRTADAQTGKVFTDIHGNRVRVDQYIFHESSVVYLLNLTQRSSGPQAGVTAAAFFTFFNRPITSEDGLLRDLPWNDYMNVVTRQELTGSFVPQQIDQFIVHEHFLGSNETGPDLYPMMIGSVFTEAVTAASTVDATSGVFWGELYSNPFGVNSDQGFFWVQGVTADIKYAMESQTDYVTAVITNNQRFFMLPSVPGQGVISGFTSTQSANLPASGDFGELDTEAGFRRLAQSGLAASFVENYGTERQLAAVFLPINDNGQVIDAPGFAIHGVRDLLNPNNRVNGGNYNLETIFVFSRQVNGELKEQFRSDVIITPEIFSGFGLKNPNGSLNTSTVFPDNLDSIDQAV